MKIDALEGKRKPESTGLPSDKRVLSVYVDKTLADDLMAIANTEKVTRSDLMRYIFSEFVKTYNEE